jgi:hypothetical protein
VPDLKTELRKLESLSFNDHGETQQETEMNEDQKLGVSARFFNIIRDNPGSPRRELVAKANGIGIATASSSTLLVQFCKRGIVRAVETNGGRPTFFSIGDQYTPGYLKRAALPKKAKAPKLAKVSKLVATAAPVQDMGVQDLLNTMSIAKARALYDELKKIFETFGH